MSFPRYEWTRDLVGEREYAEDLRWRVFEDPSGGVGQGKFILVTLGNNWTVLPGRDFLFVAKAIVEEMDRE